MADSPIVAAVKSWANEAIDEAIDMPGVHQVIALVQMTDGSFVYSSLLCPNGNHAELFIKNIERLPGQMRRARERAGHTGGEGESLPPGTHKH